MPADTLVADYTAGIKKHSIEDLRQDYRFYAQAFNATRTADMDEEQRTLSLAVFSGAIDAILAEVADRKSTEKANADPFLNAVAAPTWPVQGKVLHPVTEAGMYRQDGVIYKVQRAVHGSGHLYAKLLVVSSCGDPGDPNVTVGFEYAQGMVRKLYAEDRMTLEDAKEFGALYGTCMVCGRTLTNETSIEAGIGPVCGGRV